MHTHPLILLLLGASVLAIIVFRRCNLPPILGYLLVGSLLGPHALNLMQNNMSGAHTIAEFGVVFLMFSIGLEFSLARLYTMKRIVFGLGAAQVLLTGAFFMLLMLAFGIAWQYALALGAIISMSSTALLSKLLSERMALDTQHGKEVIGVLLFQDLAVVPLLILIPALGGDQEGIALELAIAVLKGGVLLAAILFFGQGPMKKWFHIVARAKSSELFVLNVLLITLGLAFATEQAGLSLALGAFVAGMLISETEFRIQVEEDIKPFRDVLMGLFFVTIGMYLDVGSLLENWWIVLALVLAILLVKGLIVGLLSYKFGSSVGNALRTALWLCASGEFGFVLLSEARGMPHDLHQIILSALVIAMLAAPIIVHFSEKIVLRLVASEWLLRSMHLTNIAAQSMDTKGHAIICGFGRSGQYLTRFLAMEGIETMALDMDYDRVREAAAAGENVVFGDATRRESLVAAGLSRASVVVVAVAETQVSLKVMHHAHEINPGVPVVVRTFDERDMDRLSQAGAAEVVPEYLEGSLMLASHALVLVGVPLKRVLKRLRDIRSERYQLLRGFYRGMTDSDDNDDHLHQASLHSIILNDEAWCVGKSIDELDLERFDVEVNAIRRRGIRAISPTGASCLHSGDVVVLLGEPASLLEAEEVLLKG